MVSVAQGDSTNGQKSVSEKSSFSYLEPKLALTISPMVQLELGGNFRTKKLKNTDDILGARLWDMKAAYGNSIFTGLNISM